MKLVTLKKAMRMLTIFCAGFVIIVQAEEGTLYYAMARYR